MTYARARLWLGISGVGFFVTTSAVSLWFDLPRRLLSNTSSITAIALTLATFILLSSPFDLLGGYVLPRRFHRTDLKLGSFLASWLKGVVLQAVIMGLSVLAILQAVSRAGTIAGTGVFILIVLTLLIAQLPIAALIGGLRRSTNHTALPRQTSTKQFAQSDILVYLSTDPAFVGGLVGLPGSEKLILPSAWLATLPVEVVSMQMIRRAGALATGARTRGFALGLIWNLIGFALASHAPGAGLTNAVNLINTGLWLTLWSFVGLLLLPSLNRPGVFEADSFAAKQGVTQSTIERGISELDRLQDDEPDRSRWIERVFHPIPSVSSRLATINQHRGQGAWQGARMTLYLSWACFGFLARAVHCNVGRPELWVLFPGD